MPGRDAVGDFLFYFFFPPTAGVHQLGLSVSPPTHDDLDAAWLVRLTVEFEGRAKLSKAKRASPLVGRLLSVR